MRCKWIVSLNAVDFLVYAGLCFIREQSNQRKLRDSNDSPLDRGNLYTYPVVGRCRTRHWRRII